MTPPAASEPIAPEVPLWAAWRARLAERGCVFQAPRPHDREAAVLLLLCGRTSPCLIAIVRAVEGVHGGQFALPGGRIEPRDADAWESARREAWEEIGLDPGLPTHLGTLGLFNTQASRHRVLVEVGAIAAEPEWCLDPVEVAAVLAVPLPALLEVAPPALPGGAPVWEAPLTHGYELDPRPFLRGGRLPRRGHGHLVRWRGNLCAMPFVWGLTARVLTDFLVHVHAPATRALARS